MAKVSHVQHGNSTAPANATNHRITFTDRPVTGRSVATTPKIAVHCNDTVGHRYRMVCRPFRTTRLQWIAGRFCAAPCRRQRSICSGSFAHCRILVATKRAKLFVCQWQHIDIQRKLGGVHRSVGQLLGLDRIDERRVPWACSAQRH